MSFVVILFNILLVGNYLNFSLSFLLKPRLAFNGMRNSVAGTEVVFVRSEAEAIYVMERLEEEQSQKNKKSNDKPDEEQNVFCSKDMVCSVCDDAFDNSYFSKRKWVLESKFDYTPSCIKKQISAKKDGKMFEYKRPLVRCKIKKNGQGKSPYIFLDVSTKYRRGNNLKFFVMDDESLVVNPIAFLMNKRTPPKPKETKEPTSQSAAAGKTISYDSRERPPSSSPATPSSSPARTGQPAPQTV